MECGEIGLWLRAMFEIHYTCGWRKSEPLEKLRVRLAVFARRTITIEDSKNGDERIVVMTQKIFELRYAVACERKTAAVRSDRLCSFESGRRTVGAVCLGSFHSS